jgi:hypothetical protein
MCFNPFSAPKLPNLPKLPETPSPDDDATRHRVQLLQEQLAASGGTAATVKTDLAPADIQQQQASGRRVLLGV